MKKHIYGLFLCVPVLASVLGCSQREDVPQTGIAKEITVIGTQDDFTGLKTRSMVGEVLDNGAIAMDWSVGDQIGVFGTGTTSNACFTSTNTYPIRETGFKGTCAIGEKPEYAYYPYNANASDKTAIPVSIPSVQNYSGVASVAQYDFKAANSFADLGDGKYQFNMKQLASLLRLEINLNDIAALLAEKTVETASESLKSITLSSDVRMTGDFTCDLTKLEGSNALNFSGDAGQIMGLTINFIDKPALSGTLVAYAVVAPGAQKGKTLTCTMIVNDFLSVKLSAQMLCDFEGGKYYTLPLNATVFVNNGATVEDKTPADAEPVAGQPSNCYMINAAKTYSFDATVIGNGEAGIIADAGFHATSASIDPKSAKLMWEDSEGFISGVSLVKGKVHFTAEKNVGNAMIAVFDGAGTVLWSWHIWGVGDTMPEDEVVSSQATISANSTLKVKYTVMDRALGALSKTSYFTTLYQWGRKDPIPNSTVYFVDGQAAEIETTYPVHKPGSAADATILTSIQHPECIIDDYKGQAGDWLASDNTNKYNLLWGDNNTTYVFNKSKPAAGKGWTNGKTIYDPCPSGYRVSSKFAWTGFCGSSSGDTKNIDYINFVKYENGYYFKKNSSDGVGIYFPMTGSRGCETGSLWVGRDASAYNSLNHDASYWASAPSQNLGRGARLSVSPYDASPSTTQSSANSINTVDESGNRSAVHPVRCIRE
ncbi:conserved domain protein [Bacteroides sp. CAG:770]|nr:conserved domain protein [Bacteroides sp. CAG:770]